MKYAMVMAWLAVCTVASRPKPSDSVTNSIYDNSVLFDDGIVHSQTLERGDDSSDWEDDELSYAHLHGDKESFSKLLHSKAGFEDGGEPMIDGFIDIFVDALSDPSITPDNFDAAILTLLRSVVAIPEINFEMKTRGLVFGYRLDEQVRRQLPENVRTVFIRRQLQLRDSLDAHARTIYKSRIAMIISAISCGVSVGCCTLPGCTLPVSQTALICSSVSLLGSCLSHTYSSGSRATLKHELESKHLKHDAEQRYNENLYGAIKNKYKLKKYRPHKHRRRHHHRQHDLVNQQRDLLENKNVDDVRNELFREDVNEDHRHRHHSHQRGHHHDSHPRHHHHHHHHHHHNHHHHNPHHHDHHRHHHQHREHEPKSQEMVPLGI